jgi:glutaredoxin 3
VAFYLSPFAFKLCGIRKRRKIIRVALVIYTKPGCPYCQQARDYYNSEGIPFTEYDAQNDRARRREMLAFSDNDPTVPCIVQDGEYVGSGWGRPPRG